MLLCCAVILGGWMTIVANAEEEEEKPVTASYQKGIYTYTLTATDCICKNGHKGVISDFIITDITINSNVNNFTTYYKCQITCSDPECTNATWNVNDAVIYNIPTTCATVVFTPSAERTGNYSVNYTLTRTGGEHKYKAKCSRICQNCKEVRKNNISHTVGETWDGDTKKHWKVCTACGEKDGEVEHSLTNISYDTNDSEHPYEHWYDCSICGMNKVGYEPHKIGVSTDGSRGECTKCDYSFQYIQKSILLDGSSMAGRKTPEVLKVTDIDTDQYCYDLDEENNRWIDESGEIVTSFQEGETYWFNISLVAKDGFAFKDSDTMNLSDCLLQVRGVGWEEVYSYTDFDYIYFYGKITYHEATGIPKGNELNPDLPNNTVSDKDNSNNAYKGPAWTESAAWKNPVFRLRGTAGKTFNTLKWNAIPEADGYIIYGSEYGKKMIPLQEITGGTKTTWRSGKLKKAKGYCYNVVAYKNVEAQKKFTKPSDTIYLVTKGGKYTNVKKLRAASSLKLKAGKTKKLAVKMIYAEKNKKLASYTKPLRYSATDSSVVTINSKGKVKAKKKGSCYIYVTAASGVYKKIRVKVK